VGRKGSRVLLFEKRQTARCISQKEQQPDKNAVTRALTKTLGDWRWGWPEQRARFSPTSGVVRVQEYNGSFSTAYTSPSPTTSAFGSLRENIAQLGVVFVFVDVVDADVAVCVN
jgi:hypothetical protein